MIQQIREDIQEALKKDPAARNVLEVLLCYPGVHAMMGYRVSHVLWKKNFRLLARMVSYLARWFTGIEIHPAADIGRHFFIDHGAGVVLGETSRIGDNVFIYQGVTLGGLSMIKGKRHPTIQDNVVIGAGAHILGPVTVGKNAKIGAGSVVIQDVPEYCTVIGVPGRVVFSGVSAEQEDPEEMFRDPMAQAIEAVLDRLPQMERDIQTLKSRIEELSAETSTSHSPETVDIPKPRS